MNLLKIYKDTISKNGYTYDVKQAEAVHIMQDLNDTVLMKNKAFNFFSKNKIDNKIKGIYLWGGVGRGKTFMMDMFFENIDIVKKKRFHFNHFMKYVHKNLNLLKGQKEPLKKFANNFSKETKVLCFDEFFVEDIADAMILGDLFKFFFENKMSIIATSNVIPKNLYAGGLNREYFLPAIDAIINNMNVFNLDLGNDYRWENSSHNKRYYICCDKSEQYLHEEFINIADDKNNSIYDSNIILDGYKLMTKAQNENIVWFDFQDICGHQRSTSDYIALSIHSKVILISNVPMFDGDNDDEARRFICLVDEFYDQKVMLILSAKVDMKSLYQGKRLAFAFERTVSRLHEMQGQNYPFND